METISSVKLHTSREVRRKVLTEGEVLTDESRKVLTKGQVLATISRLQNEIHNLHSFIIGFIGKDKDGEYNPNFVKKILKASHEPASILFRDKKSFLSRLKKNI